MQETPQKDAPFDLIGYLRERDSFFRSLEMPLVAAAYREIAMLLHYLTKMKMPHESNLETLDKGNANGC